MQQILIYILMFCLLSACTGTEESQPITLLIIGFEDKVGLLDTCLLVDLINDSCASKSLGTVDNPRPLLPESERDLPEDSEAISFDISDRNNERDELVVLSVKGENSERVAYLSFFNLTNIDPTPSEAKLIDSRTFPFCSDGRSSCFITLELNSSDINIDEDISPTEFCPTEIQISEEGRYISFFNNQTDCGTSLVNSINIIDLNENPPLLIKHIELGESIPEGFYIDQIDDKLYYLQESAGNLKLFSLSLDGDGDDIKDRDEEEVTSFDDNDETVVDMRSIGNGDELVVLNEEDFILISNFRNKAQVSASSPISTSFNTNELVIHDDFFITQHFYLLSNTDFVPYNTPSAGEDPESANISSTTVSGTFESINTFIYLIANQGSDKLTISKFDALTYDFQDIPRLSFFSINSPSNTTDATLEAKFISWIQATITASN